MTRTNLTLQSAKAEAKAIRAQQAKDGAQISHGQALERVANAHGFRNWNTMAAALAPGTPDHWSTGDRVRGIYLSRPFAGRLTQVIPKDPGWAFVEIALDEAIDVVSSDQFSNLRRRIRGVIGPKGFSEDRRGDGTPHMTIEPEP